MTGIDLLPRHSENILSPRSSGIRRMANLAACDAKNRAIQRSIMRLGESLRPGLQSRPQTLTRACEIMHVRHTRNRVEADVPAPRIRCRIPMRSQANVALAKCQKDHLLNPGSFLLQEIRQTEFHRLARPGLTSKRGRRMANRIASGEIRTDDFAWFVPAVICAAASRIDVLPSRCVLLCVRRPRPWRGQYAIRRCRSRRRRPRPGRRHSPTPAGRTGTRRLPLLPACPGAQPGSSSSRPRPAPRRSPP